LSLISGEIRFALFYFNSIKNQTKTKKNNFETNKANQRETSKEISIHPFLGDFQYLILLDRQKSQNILEI